MTDRVAVSPIRRHGAGAPHTDQDLVAVEQPLAVRLQSADGHHEMSLGLLMRTPGDDDDLVRGFLYSEGIVRASSEIASVQIASGAATITLADNVDFAPIAAVRAQMPTSACGLCGRLELTSGDRRGDVPANLTFSREMIARLPAALRNGQTVFAETGGLHAAALCDASGAVVFVREDVGRHNAVDKVVGAALASGLLPATRHLFAVSGRVAFEIVQKAALAGAAAIVAVGAPSDLAVQAARSAGMTLIGFARDGRFNVYSGFERIG